MSDAGLRSQRQKAVNARLRILLFCILLTAVLPAGCAKDIDVRARGETTVSIGVGNR